MNNGDQYEFAGLQRSWKSDEESPGLADLESRVRSEITLRRKVRRPRLFLVASLWVTGLLLLATYRQSLQGNLGFLALGVILLILAAWLGTSSSGPDPLTASPREYLRLRTNGKVQQLKRTHIAQFIAAFALAISLWAAWFASNAHSHNGSWQEEFLPMGVLLVTLATLGSLIVVRGSRRRELAYLRELERQFKSSDEQLSDPTPISANDQDQHGTSTK